MNFGTEFGIFVGIYLALVVFFFGVLPVFCFYVRIENKTLAKICPPHRLRQRRQNQQYRNRYQHEQRDLNGMVTCAKYALGRALSNLEHFKHSAPSNGRSLLLLIYSFLAIGKRIEFSLNRNMSLTSNLIVSLGILFAIVVISQLIYVINQTLFNAERVRQNLFIILCLLSIAGNAYAPIHGIESAKTTPTTSARYSIYLQI